MAIESDVMLFEDKRQSGEWRVEYIDDEGGCYVTIFAGPEAKQRATDYHVAIKNGTLRLVSR